MATTTNSVSTSHKADHAREGFHATALDNAKLAELVKDLTAAGRLAYLLPDPDNSTGNLLLSVDFGDDDHEDILELRIAN
jgi:hypothetical protein